MTGFETDEVIATPPLADHRQVRERTLLGIGGSVAAGTIAGVCSTFVFTVLHQIFISSIWWMLPIMAIAGALCGVCLVWCYSELVYQPSGRSLAGYVALFTTMFGLLLVVSLIIYEPSISLDAMLQSSGGNPIPLRETLPLMTVFTIGWAGFLTLLYRTSWRGFGVALVTTTVLMALLGFNVSTAGLVEIPTSAWLLIVEFFGYLIALATVFGLVYAGILNWVSNRTPGG